MDREPHERKSRIDRLKDALYSRKLAPPTDPAARTPLPREREQASRDWQVIPEPVPLPEPDAPPPPELADRTIPSVVAAKIAAMPHATVMPRIPKEHHSRLPLYFLTFALVFFLAAAGVAGYYFLGGANIISSDNIDVDITAPSIADSGKPLVIQYIITNRNQEALQAAALRITYPPGTRSPNNEMQDLLQERLEIGEVPAGGQAVKTAQAVFFGTEGAAQKIGAKLEYRLAGSDATFTRDAGVDIVIGSSPIAISVSAPDEAISGQEFPIGVTVTNNSTAVMRNVGLQAQFPFGYAARVANPAPDAGGTLWRLGDLAPGASRSVELSGALDSSGAETRVFHFSAGSEPDQTQTNLRVPLLSVPLTIAVRKPFISTRISVNGREGAQATAPLGSFAEGSVTWENTLSDTAAHAVITLALSGAPLDTSSIAGSGFYDSSKSQIIWDEQSDVSFAAVEPGQRGTVSFRFKTLPPGAKLFSNPYVDLALTVRATRAGQGSVPETVTSAAKLRVKLSSAVSLGAASSYRTGAFTNSGPLPPVRDQKTTYTVTWTVKNSSNDVGNGLVNATLPRGVEYVAGSGSDVTYDTVSRTVTWALGDVPVGAGYVAPARSASFQVALTPSVSQVGQLPPLTGKPTFTGVDRYAGVTLTAEAEAPNTRLTNDPQFRQGMEIVK